MKNFKRNVFLIALVNLAMATSVYAAKAKTKLTLEEATAIASKKVPGDVKSSEFEHEMGQDVYSFDILGSDKKIHEILINANTGKIVSNKTETAAKEAKEAIEEKK